MVVWPKSEFGGGTVQVDRHFITQSKGEPTIEESAVT